MRKRDFDMDTIAKEYLDGARIKELCKKYVCAGNTMRDRLRKHGITLRVDVKGIILREVKPNEEFGRLICSGETKKINGDIYCWCKCTCPLGTEKWINKSSLVCGYTVGCGCVNKESVKKRCFTGYEQISGKFWTRIKKQGYKRGLEFTCSIEQAWELYLIQDGKCSLTGIELTFGVDGGEITASLDRIDSTKGYIEGNIQWVHKYLNWAKRSHSQEYFIELCTLVASHAQSKQPVFDDWYLGANC